MQTNKQPAALPRYRTMPELAWLTTQQLRIAYREVRRPNWPDTPEEALLCDAKCVAIVRVAVSRARAPLTGAYTCHSLPRLPAPPTPQQHDLAAAKKPGRGPYSLAKGLPTGLAPWPKKLPTPFDYKKAQANDLDN